MANYGPFSAPIHEDAAGDACGQTKIDELGDEIVARWIIGLKRSRPALTNSINDLPRL